MLYLVAVRLLPIPAYGGERTEQRWLCQRSDGEWFKCRGEVRSADPAARLGAAAATTERQPTPHRCMGHEWRTDVRTWGQTGRDLRIVKRRSLTISNIRH